MTYICNRTGETFVNQAVAENIHGVGYCDNVAPVAVVQAAIIIPVSASSPGGVDTRARDASGNLITNQIGSQFWMNEGFTGPEPTLEVKAAFSTAEYASGWIGAYVQTLIDKGVTVTDDVKQMALYPAASSPVLKALWQANPTISPQGAYDVRLAQATLISPTATTTGAVTVASSSADTATNTGATTAIGGLMNTLGQYAVYIAIGVAIIIIAAIVMARGHISGGAPAS